MRLFLIPAALASLSFAPAAAIQTAPTPPASTFENVWGVPPPAGPFSDKRDEVVLAAQIMLARARHSPGVIDGYRGGNTSRAIRAFERARGLPVDGRLDEQTLQALRDASGGAPLMQRYTIAAEDLAGGFADPAMSMEQMAATGRVGYGSPAEKLAEKFGMGLAFFRTINDGVPLNEGSRILVVNADPGPLPPIDRVEVDGSRNEVRAYGEGGGLVATFPATVGSGDFPSPSGTMEVKAVAPEANYVFNPSDLSWGGDEVLTIPAGPNNPVGGIWIDLSKEGYGLHGSPDSGLIGKTASHGCVRLTNWDAARLAEAVQPGTSVAFQ